MSYQIKVPAVGESITSGVISTWHKKNNDQVAVGDLLFTLETDKVSTEITATETGVLKTLVDEGAEVKIGAVVAEITAASPAAAPQLKLKDEVPLQSDGIPAKAGIEPLPLQSRGGDPANVSAIPIPAPTPAPLSVVEPTASAVPALIPEGRVTRKKLTPLRRKIAAQLVSAQQTAAILTTFNECDMSAVMKLRKDVQEKFQAKHGVKLGFMSFFIKAAVEALQAVPGVNAQLEGEELIQNHYYDIGVAVGTEKGLVVPVVRDCEKQSLGELETQLLGYATKAREGKIGLADLQGGVFTISNGGVYGSLLSTPILNPPQSGILGMHKIQERPVVVEGKIEIRPMMYLALSYDHRVIDGQQAVTFLIKIKEAIENPMRLLMA
ncbi:MAG: dihydrolipoyllysine-residue succinyltransferase [Verrucomicrobia bacterium]|nr:dihydrolipoyllysine-residue succinyltransferase [Verrucomicrobiota bacterium]